MSVYFDGRIIRAYEFDESDIPTNIDTIRIGNQASANRPAQCIIEDVFVEEEKLEAPQLLRCIDIR